MFFSYFISAADGDGPIKAKRTKRNISSYKKSSRKYIDPIIGTYLGNKQNNYYGKDAPDKLDVIWRHYLGYGNTNSPKNGIAAYYGAGWTGQVLIIKEKSVDYLVIGAYDHNLKKINCETGGLIWNYEYDDIIKGTGSLWINKHAKNPEEKYVILQGSRRGVNNKHTDKIIESFRAVSFLTGKELWRLNVKQTSSYSRDVDGTALVFGDTVIIGLENGILALLNPSNLIYDSISGKSSPEILSEHYLYDKADISKHGGNLVTESTPCVLNDKVYITAGSGHLYGYNLKNDTIDWDLYIGADMNGSPVVANDNCLLIPIEKQYINGYGGIMKVDPGKPPNESVVWYFPTGNRKFADWSGGVIGTVGINDKKLQIAAFNAIDGYLYVVSHNEIDSTVLVKGPNNINTYSSPKELFKYEIGPSISTPIIVNNKIIAAGYNGLYIFQYDQDLNFTLSDNYPGVFESTPAAYNNRIYLASRDGYLYCFGDTSTTVDSPEVIAETVEWDEPETKVEEHPVTEPIKEEKIRISENSIEPIIAYLNFVNQRLEMNKKIPEYNGEILSYILENIKINPVKDETNEEVVISSDKKYHLITGSFTIKENAVKFCAKLKSEGFEACMFGPRGGFYFVSLASYTSSEDATKSIPVAVNQGYKDAWVMQYRLSN